MAVLDGRAAGGQPERKPKVNRQRGRNRRHGEESEFRDAVRPVSRSSDEAHRTFAGSTRIEHLSHARQRLPTVAETITLHP